MSLAPRSLVHAIHQFNAPRLRASRTPAGERALVFEQPPRAAPPVALETPSPDSAAVTPDLGARPSEGLGGARSRRFIDDDGEVGFRSGLLRSTRDSFDLYVAPAGREQELSSLGPVERVRLAEDGEELPALRITPDVRRRVNAGQMMRAPPAGRRFLFAAADGEGFTPTAGAQRVNEAGFVYSMPWADQWGDTRFNPQDRARAIATLREIVDRGPEFWREAPWDVVVRAADDIDTITGNLFYWAPDVQERVGRLAGLYGDEARARRWMFAGEVREYLRWRDGQPGGPDERPSLLVPEEGAPIDSVRGPIERLAPKGAHPEDIREFGDLAREAVETLLRARRRGVRDLLRHDMRDEPKGPKPITDPVRDKANRYSAVRRAVETLADDWFADEDGRGGRPGAHLLNAIRKARNVAREEVDQLDLGAFLTNRPVTREALLSWIDDRALMLRMLENQFDPARPTRQYELGGTRAFDGPRVPGHGKYFERRFLWPARRGRRGKGEPILASDYPHAHWEDGTWGSIRGSVREVPKFGRGVLGEELQRDFYQGVNQGKVRPVSDGDYAAAQRQAENAADLRQYLTERLNSMARIMGSTREAPAEARTAWNTALMVDPRGLSDPLTWRRIADVTEEHPTLGPPELLADIRSHANAAMAALSRRPGLLQNAPERHDSARSGVTGLRHLTDTMPEQPFTDSQSTRFLVRDLFIKNAREGGEWVAIPTGSLNDRIQYNTINSAAFYYDGTLQNVLGKVARDIDPSLTVERVILPTPPLKRGVPVYMVRGITPEINERLKRDGMPLYAMAAQVDDGPPMNSARYRDQVEADLRRDERWGKAAGDLMDANVLQLIPDDRGLPAHVLEAAAEQGGIPYWVGAVHDRNTGTTYFLTDRIPDYQLRGLMVHEIGAHHGLPAMLGKRRHAAFLKHLADRIAQEEAKFATLVEAGEAHAGDREFHPWLRAYDIARKNYAGYREDGRVVTNPRELTPDQLDEVAANMAEMLEMTVELHGWKDEAALRADRTWWQNLLADIKRWAVTALGVGELTARDVHYLAMGGLKREARRARFQSTGEAMVAVPESRILAYAKARGFEGDNAGEAAAWLDAQGYFSPALEAARRFPQETATREQMVGWLQNQPGVKKDELNTLFLDEFVKPGGKATRAEFVEWLQAHRYETRVTFQSREGEEAGLSAGAQWGGYTYLSTRDTGQNGPPGYFEMIVDAAGRFRGREGGRKFDMPGEHFEGGHFQGGLAHVRGVNDTPVAGKNATLLVEIQSDYFDVYPSEFRDIHEMLLAQRAAMAAIERDFGAEGAALWRQVQEVDRNARLIRATSEGPPDVYAIVFDWSGSGSTASAALRAKVREFNSRAEALSDQRTRENGGAFPADRQEEFLNSAAWRAVHQAPDVRAPYRQTWPEKAFTDAVREAIRNGAERIAWSTGDAVRTIAGMSTYKGDLYDARIPRLARRWLGVEAKKGRVENATGRGDGAFEQRENAVYLAMYEQRGDVGALRGDKELDVLHEAMEDLARSRFGFFEKVYDDPSPEARAAERARFLQEIQTYPWTYQVNRQEVRVPVFDGRMIPENMREAVLDYVGRQVDRAMDAVAAIASQREAADYGVQAWYFDVTDEVRAKALAPRSLFFGRAERIDPGFVDTKGRSIFGSRTPVMDKLADGDAPDYRTRGPDGEPVTKREANTAIGTAAAGAAGVVGSGVAAVVEDFERGREARKAEFERLEAEQRLADKQRASQDVRREFAAERREAIAAGDWESLPPPKADGAETPAAALRAMSLQDRREYAHELTAIAEAATGVPADMLMSKIARETAYTFFSDIGPGTTAAWGWGQFMPDTWAGELIRNGERLGFDVAGRSRASLRKDAQVQALREDPRFAVLMTAIHARENILHMEEKLGRPPTQAEVYAAHFFGVDRALQFVADVDADLSVAATQRRYRREADDNPGVFRPGGRALSARQVFQQMTEEFGDEPVVLGEALLFPDESGDAGDDSD